MLRQLALWLGRKIIISILYLDLRLILLLKGEIAPGWVMTIENPNYASIYTQILICSHQLLEIMNFVEIICTSLELSFLIFLKINEYFWKRSRKVPGNIRRNIKTWTLRSTEVTIYYTILLISTAKLLNTEFT